MKKVFLSVPMRNRTKENIEKSLEKMKAITKAAIGEDIEFINTVVEDKPPYTTANEAIWYLGKSIQLLSQADILVTVEIPYWLRSPGVETEREIFRNYNNKSTYIQLPVELVIDEKELEELDALYEKSCVEAKVSR